MFSSIKCTDLVEQYTAVMKELQHYRGLDGVWSFTFVDPQTDETITKRVRMTDNNEQRAFDLDNVLTNCCMIEKVILEEMPSVQSFWKSP